ncbi:MAG: PEP-CTERM sorting domain-containing protein [Tychonema bourrellyi B0820]|uniref:PEP-CTERM sorting domain-containing protein n=1 Tax=Tychonema bourrellyi FEM_GT703 TaxID=2040638 RepID=A0A2G4EZ90_9CYAN|nr:PEP-CTERM sorting domain-containing protein [Tychonema bourrellyi]MDQ2100937.1 PEP-CTERM sorting domain-containing protein [Tychonema bourrellyi B0820]PHX54833.1 PEP-CTERM sorting domain-containing protein [Tychonema bourrellyi FEM_GT703]
MKINHGIGSIAVLFATPLVTGLSVGIAPSSAAIIAGSAAEVSIDNFSHRPTDTGTFTNTYTQAIANKGAVISAANANAVFLSNCQQLLAANLSESTVKGEGSKYSGLAQSQAAIIGDFDLDAKETFSFTFQTFLRLLTSVDNPQSERVSAQGNLSFLLIDTVSNILLDSFQLGGSLHSFKRGDLSLSYSDSFNPTQINLDFLAQGNTKESVVYSSGVYARTFDNATNLRLVEVKNNLVLAESQPVREAEPVPEPTTILGTAMFFGFLAKGRKLQK